MDIRDELSDEGAQVAVGLFALLLKGYERFRPAPAVGTCERFEFLIQGFQSIGQRPRAVLTEKDRDELLLGHLQAIEADRIHQQAAADDFNLLDVLRATYNEARHSMVLAWVLDADLRKHGTHAQGNLGFRLFLQEVGLSPSYAEQRYWVRREVAGEDARVDVEVARRGHFLIHIENKIRAGEGSRQSDREWSDLQRRAATLGIVNPNNVHALFLTPTGVPAANANFRPISWRNVADVLERFAEAARPRDVQLFAAHYARALRRFVVGQEIKEDEGYGEANV